MKVEAPCNPLNPIPSSFDGEGDCEGGEEGDGIGDNTIGEVVDASVFLGWLPFPGGIKSAKMFIMLIRDTGRQVSKQKKYLSAELILSSDIHSCGTMRMSLSQGDFRAAFR